MRETRKLKKRIGEIRTANNLLKKGLRRMQVRFQWAARKIRCIHLGGLLWQRGVVRLLIFTMVTGITFVAMGLYHVYFDRTNLPDIEPFTRFEFPTIGHVYDANGQPLIEVAREYRRNIKYEDIPPIVRDAIIATEDKNFFTHSGVDYSVFPRVLSKVRIGALVARLTEIRRDDKVNRPAVFPHGGSTITQQLVRGYFLKNMTVFQNMTDQENSKQLRQGVKLAQSAILHDRLAKRQHAGSEDGRDSTVVVGRKQDAGAFRFETPR